MSAVNISIPFAIGDKIKASRYQYIDCPICRGKHTVAIDGKEYVCTVCKKGKIKSDKTIPFCRPRTQEVIEEFKVIDVAVIFTEKDVFVQYSLVYEVVEEDGEVMPRIFRCYENNIRIDEVIPQDTKFVDRTVEIKASNGNTTINLTKEGV